MIIMDNYKLSKIFNVWWKVLLLNRFFLDNHVFILFYVPLVMLHCLIRQLDRTNALLKECLTTEFTASSLNVLQP